MEIKSFNLYRDGGTVRLDTDKGIFCFDYRIETKTKGALYKDFPKDDNSNLIENSHDLEKELIESLRHYKDDSCQISIDYFLNLRQK